MHLPRPHPTLLAVALAVASAAVLVLAGTPAVAAPAAACAASSGPAAATVVELYTSEGCSSCPPADRWLSTLRGQAGVVALGFHVDYWDSLGWKDRFASPAFTRRQAESQRDSGARFSYTPQVLVDGADYRAWPSLPAHDRAAPVQLALAIDGDALRLQVAPQAGTPLPARLVAEVEVVDDGLQSRVKAGENRGEALRHDGVVRAVIALPGWAGTEPHVARVAMPAGLAAPEAGSTRHWAAIVRDAGTGRPLQALELRCGG